MAAQETRSVIEINTTTPGLICFCSVLVLLLDWVTGKYFEGGFLGPFAGLAWVLVGFGFGWGLGRLEGLALVEVRLQEVLHRHGFRKVSDEPRPPEP